MVSDSFPRILFTLIMGLLFYGRRGEPLSLGCSEALGHGQSVGFNSPPEHPVPTEGLLITF